MDDVRKSLDEIKNNIKEINSSMREIDKTLVKQEAQLAEHIRRTNLLESKIEPVEKHIHMVNGALKLLGILSIVVGIIASIFKIVS